MSDVLRLCADVRHSRRTLGRTFYQCRVLSDSRKVKWYMASAIYLSYVWKLRYKIAKTALNVARAMGMSRKRNVIDRSAREYNLKP